MDEFMGYMSDVELEKSLKEDILLQIRTFYYKD